MGKNIQNSTYLDLLLKYTSNLWENVQTKDIMPKYKTIEDLFVPGKPYLVKFNIDHKAPIKKYRFHIIVLFRNWIAS